MKAWELLEENGWCQKHYAENAIGAKVGAKSTEACRFCVVGLLYATDTFLLNYEKIRKYLNDRSEVPVSVVDWNDHPSRTEEEVLAVLKELDI